MRITSGFTGRVKLYVLPYLLKKLINARHEPSLDLPALSRLIKFDPALCFLAMRLDRSMGSPSHPSEPTGIDGAIDRIGMAGIDAITAKALADQGFNSVHHQRGLSLAWLWRHCLTTALLAQGLALELNFRPVEAIYLAGLLHDIGKLALCTRIPVACTPLLADPTQANPLLEAEAKVAGSAHCRIGAQLIRWYTDAWFASDAARYHTAPLLQIKNALPLVKIVWSANCLAADPHSSSDAFQAVEQLLVLDSRKLSRLSQIAVDQVLVIATELGVPPDDPDQGRRNTDERIFSLDQEIKTCTVLSSLYKELLMASDINGIIRLLRQSLSSFLGIDTLILFDHEPQSNFLAGYYATENAFPWPIDRLQIPLTASDSLPVGCHINDETVDSFSIADPNKLTILDHQLMTYLNTDGFVCLPLQPGINGNRGCLVLGIDGRDWPWVQQQAPLLKAIVAAVAGALKRTHRQHDQVNCRIADSLAPTVARTRKIVHEINNPLGIIKNYLKVLAQRTDENSFNTDEIRIISDEINRVAKLAKSLTLQSEMVPRTFESADIYALVSDIVRLFQKSLSAKTAIRLDQDLDARIPAIPIDRDLLKQALMNLLKNAAEATPDGGTIIVRTKMSSGKHRQAGHSNRIRRIKISVCDDGPGIDGRVKETLFRPHVTSKAGHDGLGLPIAHESVLHLNGSLYCENAPERGTCFHIELPVGDNDTPRPDELSSTT